MVGTEFFDVTIAMDYHNHNEDSVSAEPRQGIVVVNNGSTSASYVEVDETPIEDYGQDVLKLDAGKEAHDQGEPSENDGQRSVHNIGDMQPPLGYRVRLFPSSTFQSKFHKIKCY